MTLEDDVMCKLKHQYDMEIVMLQKKIAIYQSLFQDFPPRFPSGLPMLFYRCHSSNLLIPHSKIDVHSQPVGYIAQTLLFPQYRNNDNIGKSDEIWDHYGKVSEKSRNN